MNIGTIILTFLAAFLSLTTGLLLAKVNRIEKKADKRYEEAIRRELLLSTHRTDISVLLLEVVQAVQDDRCNGELQTAKETFKATNRQYDEFVRKQASERLAELSKA